MPSRAFWFISASGLVPLIVCLVLAWRLPALREAAVHTFLVYMALTLAFLGGTRWGAELARAPAHPDLVRLGLSAAPTVIGLVALLPQLPTRIALVCLVVAGLGQLTWDIAGSRDGLLPPWNAWVRLVLTMAATLCALALWPVMP